MSWCWERRPGQDGTQEEDKGQAGVFLPPPLPSARSHSFFPKNFLKTDLFLG